MKDISRNGRTVCHTKAKASAADEVEVLSARAASNDVEVVEVVSVTPAQRFYGMSALNGKPVNITPQTYKQIDDYIEMRVQDEFERLRQNDQYAGVDDRTLRSQARNRVERYRPQTQEQIEHFAWVQERKDLFGDNMHDYNCWSGYEPKDQHHGAWKMHLYSVNEADWREMCDVVIPYLKQNDVEWKTFCAGYMPEELGGNQAGKAFTVYPKNNQDMAKVARDLDALIRQHRLETANSHIVGDNQMGSTGRLFYRYELSSGQYKDQILDLNNPNDYALYHQLYDGNRGDGNYLAFDMTEADDIWRNFDPSDPNARPSTSSSAQSSSRRTSKLQKG